jgi:REP element-mobilizing transposase RayT
MRLSKQIRLSPELYAIAGRTYFITIRTDFWRVLFAGSAQLNDAILDCLLGEARSMNHDIVVCCLMPDHVHFLARPAVAGISVIDLVSRFKGKSTRVAWQHGHQGVLWQRRWFDHIVRRSESLATIVRYIIDNPVRKGIVPVASDYCWSKCMEWNEQGNGPEQRGQAPTTTRTTGTSPYTTTRTGVLALQNRFIPRIDGEKQ